MNPTLVVGLWAQRLRSPLRVVILTLMILLPPSFLLPMPSVGLTALGDGFPLGILFAAGMIGQDVSSGVLQLLFARPVRRWEYVLSRWLGAAAGALSASAIQIALAWIILVVRDAPPEASAVGLFAAQRALEVVGITAVMALLSSLMNGLGDLALYVLLNILGGALAMSGQAWRADALSWAALELQTFLAPRIEMAPLAAGAIPWNAILIYLSNLTLALTLAVALVNRKELSYASG